MKKVLVLLVTACLFIGCNVISQGEIVNNMECPITLIGKVESTSGTNAAIVLKGGDNKVQEMVCTKAFSTSILNSYEVGDTVIFCE